jgi:hypothetical protein
MKKRNIDIKLFSAYSFPACEDLSCKKVIYSSDTSQCVKVICTPDIESFTRTLIMLGWIWSKYIQCEEINRGLHVFASPCRRVGEAGTGGAPSTCINSGGLVAFKYAPHHQITLRDILAAEAPL